jgi:hypothetical protein
LLQNILMALEEKDIAKAASLLEEYGEMVKADEN